MNYLPAADAIDAYLNNEFTGEQMDAILRVMSYPKQLVAEYGIPIDSAQRMLHRALFRELLVRGTCIGADTLTEDQRRDSELPWGFMKTDGAVETWFAPKGEVKQTLALAQTEADNNKLAWAALKKAEYSMFGYGGRPTCPVCLAIKDEFPHKEHCEIAKALASAPEWTSVKGPRC